MAKSWKTLVNGLWNGNPTFRLLIGLCPVLAVTTRAVNGIGMGLATTFVIVCSSVLISLLRKVIPDKVRIPAYIIVIATFVTIVDLVMNAYLPDLHQVLGLFIPCRGELYRLGARRGLCFRMVSLLPCSMASAWAWASPGL